MLSHRSDKFFDIQYQLSSTYVCHHGYRHLKFVSHYGYATAWVRCYGYRRKQVLTIKFWLVIMHELEGVIVAGQLIRLTNSVL